MLERRCRDSGEKFVVDDHDLRFYDRVSPVFGGERFEISPPVLSPASRLKQRLSFRNQTHVYFRKSSRSRSSVFTSYPEPCPFPIVSVDEWWSDDWDETEFGTDFDFSEAFFPQFMRLRDRVPHLPLSVSHLENSDYCSNASYLKDCYLVFNSSKAEDCIYCEAVTGSKSCIDCSYTKESELCYDCTMCIRCYECRSCLYSTGCRDSSYLMNCVNCSNCFGCVNLRNRSFCYYNEQLSEVEYRARIASFNTGSWTQTAQARETAMSFWRQNPRPNVEIENCDNCSGNYIYNSKGVRDSFFVRDCEDVRYAFGLDNGARDCQDITIPGFNPELCYQGMIIGFNVYRCLFSYRVAHQCSNLIYCWLCFYSKDCFGCVGLRRKQYCIFNKQYTKEQYEILVPKIIRKMQETGEWGQFFPAHYSAIPYNLSFAQRYFPRTKEQALATGQRWLDEQVSESADAIPADSLPDSVDELSDSLVIRSESTGASFKITKHEIVRYRKMKIPLPRSTYRERMDARFSLLGGVEPRPSLSKKSGQQIVTFPSAGKEEMNQIIWERQEYLGEFA
jgi:hypothetical protein